MAVTKYKILKGQVAVYTDPTNASTFATANLKLVGGATSADISIDAETSETVFLGDADPEWKSPEVTKKGWTANIDALKLYADVAGTRELDDATSVLADSLEVGQHVWLAFSKAGFADGFKYGKAVITSIKEAFQSGENNTVSLSLSGIGAIAKYTAA